MGGLPFLCRRGKRSCFFSAFLNSKLCKFTGVRLTFARLGCVGSCALLRLDNTGSEEQGQRGNITIPAQPTPDQLSVEFNPRMLVLEGGNSGLPYACLTTSSPLAKNSNVINGYNCSRWFVVKEKARRGPHSNLMLARNYTKKTEVKKHKRAVEGVATVFDDLFTNKRDYLVKFNGQQVHADQLAGKVVILFFVPLLPIDFDTTRCLISLVDTYNYLLPTNNFEVVFVPYISGCKKLSYGDCEIKVEPSKHFEELFSRMPWTAIPYSDRTARRCLQRKYVSVDCGHKTIVIDTNGNVLRTDHGYYFEQYGGQGYPFTDTKIKSLKSQDDAIAKQPSLGALLASPERDYVITNRGDKVPIHTLEEKVVALFFYEDGFTDWFTEEIKTAYEELTKNKENFEVVLIYLYDTGRTYDHTDEGSFWEKFKTMPWLALPFRDPNCRKLMRLFSYPPCEDSVYEATTLVIVGPGGKFIEPWGVMSSHDNISEAFPFTRERFVQLYTEKVKELKLEMLWSPNTVFSGKDETKVQLSQLAGKRIILFFESYEVNNYVCEFLKMLKELYLIKKGTDDEFEVIYISYSEKESCYAEHVEDVSWLVSPATELLPADYRLYCCFCQPILLRADSGSAYTGSCLPGQCHGLSSILAFDVDGRLVRKSIYPTVEHMDFPFYAGGMEKESYFNHDDFFCYSSRFYNGLQRDSYSNGNSYA